MRNVHRSILAIAIALAGVSITSPAPAHANPSARSASARVASACAGLSEDEVAQPLFGGRLDVVRSRALRTSGAKAVEPRKLGVELFVRAEPGLTARYLERLATCHVARYEASLASSHVDPLAVSGVEVRVRESGTGFVVQIASERRSTANAVLERATALDGRTSSRAVADAR